MTAKEIVAQVTNLPVMPSATVKLVQLLENPTENTQAALEEIGRASCRERVCYAV